MQILHLDSSILGDHSTSRKISALVMEKLTAAHPDAKVIYRDLAAEPLTHMSGAYMAVMMGMLKEYGPELAADLELGEALIQELLGSDTIVIGVALYNLTVPTQLKAWIDRIVMLNKTFRYTKTGELEGLAGGKRVILCVSRGGFYAEGSPGAATEHCARYLKDMFAFIGITDVEVIAADGISVGPEHAEKAMEHVNKEVAALSV